MARIHPLVALAKLVTKDMTAGRPGEGVDLAMLAAEQIPDAAEQLIELIVAEGQRKKPNAKLIDALAMMLGHALETLRYGVERKLPEALARADAVRDRLIRLGQGGDIGVDTLMMILRQFSVAKLDPGDDLRGVMTGLVEDAGAETGVPDIRELTAHLAEIAGAVADEFELFAELQEFSVAFPDDSRALFAAATVAPQVERLKEASVGWLLDPASPVRTTIASVFQQTAQRRLMSGTMLRRMIAVRNWVPESDRPAIDDAIKASRLHGVAIAPLKAAQIRDVFVSGWDGSGAQSVFVVVREGRKFAVASLLLKLGFGVRDAWVQHGGSRRDVDGLLDEVGYRVGLIPSTEEYVAKALAHGLAVNAASGVMPPFGLLDAVETTGLATLQPQAVAVEEMVRSLYEAIPPERLAPKVVEQTVKDSIRWEDAYPFVASWFEDDAAVGEVLGSKRMEASKAFYAVLDGVLEGHRRKWAELMAWTAFALQESDEADDWENFTIVAHELLAGRALRGIPAMMKIARITAEVHGLKRRR